MSEGLSLLDKLETKAKTAIQIVAYLQKHPDYDCARQCKWVKVSDVEAVLCRLEQQIKDKARRPMQEAGVYDPMEQGGHRDMVSVDYVLVLLFGKKKEP